MYTSPLERAGGDGEAIADHHRLVPVVIPDLEEVAVFRDAPQHLSSLKFMGA